MWACCPWIQRCAVVGVALVAGAVFLSGSGSTREEAVDRGGNGRREVRPLRRAHAHNDYRHEAPLRDALSHGFTSVEADIFLVDGDLLVGHDREELRSGRTLEKLYLEPLAARARENNGRIFRNGPEFVLLVDIKSGGRTTYEALEVLLARYGGILTTVEDGRREVKAVTVVISGNRDWDAIARSSPRHAGVDGRLSDLDSERPPHLMPLVSDNWRSHFQWRGEGRMPSGEREKLHRIVEKSHAKGRKVRFWATPESLGLWKELLLADVDYINTDDLAGLERFLRSAGESEGR